MFFLFFFHCLNIGMKLPTLGGGKALKHNANVLIKQDVSCRLKISSVNSKPIPQTSQFSISGIKAYYFLLKFYYMVWNQYYAEVKPFHLNTVPSRLNYVNLTPKVSHWKRAIYSNNFLSLVLHFQTLYLRCIIKQLRRENASMELCTLFSMAMHLCNCKDIFRRPYWFNQEKMYNRSLWTWKYYGLSQKQTKKYLFYQSLVQITMVVYFLVQKIKELWLQFISKF